VGRCRVVSITAAIAAEGWTESFVLAIHFIGTFCEIRHHEMETNRPEGYKEMQDSSAFEVTQNHVVMTSDWCTTS
jgi:hypothetical protein